MGNCSFSDCWYLKILKKLIFLNKNNNYYRSTVSSSVSLIILFCVKWISYKTKECFFWCMYWFICLLDFCYTFWFIISEFSLLWTIMQIKSNKMVKNVFYFLFDFNLCEYMFGTIIVYGQESRVSNDCMAY